MPKAEKGTPKDLANRMKSRGLQKLAFYCQVCEKQMRDQNGFKQHCASEPHVRMMLLVGQNPSKAINDYSKQFKHDFLQLLRTAHGEKRIQANHFYQEYIGNKSHIHMNGTHWKTLSEFVKSLGREGICRVDDGDKGLFISWIDNSPEALNRQAAIRKKDKQDKGDEERANQLIAEQIERANADIKAKESGDGTNEAREDVSSVLRRDTQGKIKITFGTTSKSAPAAVDNNPVVVEGSESTDIKDPERSLDSGFPSSENGGYKPVSLSKPPALVATKKQNVFAKVAKAANATSSQRPTSSLDQKSLSNAQQMILEEQDRKRRQENLQRRKEEATRRPRVY